MHYERIYGKEIQRLDPNHPSLVGFEIVYQWRAADDTDFSSGIFEMFLMALIFGTAIVFLAVVYDPMQKASKPVMAKRIRSRR